MPERTESPQPKRSKRFKTQALNEFVNKYVILDSFAEEYEQLRNDIENLKQDQKLAKEFAKKPGTCLLEVVNLLNEVVTKGKLPQICSSENSGAAIDNPSFGDTNPPRNVPQDVREEKKEETLELQEVLKTVETMAGNNLSNLEGSFIYINNDNRKSWKELTINEGGIQYEDDWKDLNISEIWFRHISTKDHDFFFRGQMTKRLIRDALLKAKVIKKELTKHAVKDALTNSMKKFLASGIEKHIKYTQGLVTTEPPNPKLDIATNDLSRAVVLVVAGESGSGKSRYSVGALAGSNGNTALLRYSLKVSTFEAFKGDQKRQALRKLIELVTSELYEEKLSKQPIYSALRRVSDHVNEGRNGWAVEQAKKMIEVAIEDARHASSKSDPNVVSEWYDVQAGKALFNLDKLVVIFDECGLSPDFVAGIIATARERFLPFLRDTQGLANEVGLVLCGSGLEAVKAGTSGNRFLGCDPAVTRVVTMRTTVLGKLEDQDLCKAIDKGVISRIVAGNARMLTHGLIPALTSNLVVEHVKEKNDIMRRRVAFGSFRFAMDFCVRKYVNLSGLMNFECDKRTKLLERSFRFLMRSALQAIQTNQVPQCAQLLLEQLKDADEREDSDGNGGEELFRIGLVTRDPTKTSNALKYLACSGAAEYVCSADGYSFEIVLTAHLERFYTATSGHRVGNFELKHAWPPAAEKNAPLTEDGIKNRVDQMVKNGEDDIREIVNYFKKATDDCEAEAALVLRQGVSNAQGADVMMFVLKCEGVGLRLELSIFQAKNWKGKRYASAMNKAAISLGIDAAASNNPPESGSAGYSYEATMKLGNEVANRLGQKRSKTVDFCLTKRVIVFAYSSIERTENDAQGFNGLDQKPELWSREMLEPTISALLVATDSDDSEDNPDTAEQNLFSSSSVLTS